MRDLKAFHDLINHASAVNFCIDLDIIVPECLTWVNLCEINNHRNPIDVAILFQKIARVCLKKEKWSRLSKYSSLH